MFSLSKISWHPGYYWSLILVVCLLKLLWKTYSIRNERWVLVLLLCIFGQGIQTFWISLSLFVRQTKSHLKAGNRFLFAFSPCGCVRQIVVKEGMKVDNMVPMSPFSFFDLEKGP